ncbi:hypothetical protein [Mycobacteroides abscessus]|uniref:hypothetical protein n=1 Tax=Mycobacteroides abscessus TaxID=36809 RepID=UPI0005E30EFD|nr:hypothetical protein [Mycobacteroides abscessus]CPW73211.1 Uncharacterised protein [Mycobacteroides abscessus]SKF61023.1 Uncharacterised protein [Mycobacteroides abscessus subsp. bolletii]SKH65708.1 Uncharacterised protein [Mycobacteroides abscessus subsp. bolletii]
MNDSALTIILIVAGALMLIVGLGSDSSWGSFAPTIIAGMGGILLGLGITDAFLQTRR